MSIKYDCPCKIRSMTFERKGIIKIGRQFGKDTVLDILGTEKILIIYNK